MVIGLPGGRRVRGLRPDPYEPARQPARRRCGRSRRSTLTWSCAGQRLDRRPRRRHAPRDGPWSRPGWAGRRPVARSPTCSTGTVNPSGRLAETISAPAGGQLVLLQLPRRLPGGAVRGGLFIGYRGYDKAQQDVAFPFGFGLVLHHFELSDLQVDLRGSSSTAPWPRRSPARR